MGLVSRLREETREYTCGLPLCGANSRAVNPDGPEAANIIERMTEALTAVREYYFLANPTKLTEAYVCDLVCSALTPPSEPTEK